MDIFEEARIRKEQREKERIEKSATAAARAEREQRKAAREQAKAEKARAREEARIERRQAKVRALARKQREARKKDADRQRIEKSARGAARAALEYDVSALHRNVQKLKEAGLNAKQIRTAIDKQKREERRAHRLWRVQTIKDAYYAGATQRQMAELAMCSVQNVQRILKSYVPNYQPLKPRGKPFGIRHEAITTKFGVRELGATTDSD